MNKVLGTSNLLNKKDNKWLLNEQLKTLQYFYERNLLTKEQYDFEVKMLTIKIDTQK